MNRIIHLIIAFSMLWLSEKTLGQTPVLGRTASYVLFTSIGAVSNTGISQITGDVGTNIGSCTNFGNVNGVMHAQDTSSAGCVTDLLILYGQLNAAVPTFFPAPTMGNGDTLLAGVHLVTGASSLNNTLYLDAKNNSGAVFIIKIQGPLSAAANSKVQLINGAKACNVFWKIEGLLSMATGTTMRGTIVVNNAAINMSAGDTLEGRALSTTGAVTVNGVMASTSVGCGSPFLTGPPLPALGAVACFTLFSSIGPVTNTLITNVTGDIGSNNGLTTGFDTLLVTGKVHAIPDTSTAACSTDLHSVYLNMNALPYDIELLYPAQFGRNLVLTPHTYIMNGAVTFTDTLYLNGMGNANGVFIIKIYGALSTSTFSRVILINGTQAKNVFWLVNGAVDINDNSIFRGTIICNNGAVDLNNGVLLDGRALTTTGALNTSAIVAVMPPGCPNGPPNITVEPTIQSACIGDTVRFIVTATGSALTYQWRRGAVNLINGGNISGATNDTLSIFPVNNADTGSNYNVIVSGTYLPNDTSVDATLKLNTPFIVNEPADKIVCTGDTARFFVAATGAGLQYQWRRGTVNLINGVTITGATTDTLRIFPVTALDTASNYNVVVSGVCAPGDTSSNVFLRLNIPVITTEPVNQNACIGNTVRFVVKASGSGLTFQWRKGNTTLVNNGTISGVTNDTLTISPASTADTASNYHVVVTGACVPSDTSINVFLRLNEPRILVQPTSKIVCLGTSTFLSVSSGGGGLTYQWRKGLLNLVNGGNISGANSDTLRINPVGYADSSSVYSVIINGLCSPNDTSALVSLAVNSPVVITTSPANQNVCVGSAALFVTAATGSGLTYQWRKGLVNLVNGGNISGANTDSLKINPAGISDAGSNYHVIITGTCSPNDTSANVSLSVGVPVVINTIPSNQIICVGDSAEFVTGATGTGVTYQWRKGTTLLVNGGNISGANGDSLKINPAGISDAGSNYNVIISGTCSANDTSLNVSLIIGTPLIVHSAPVNQTVCTGGTAVFTTNVSGGGITYQWRKGTVNLINGGNISGANTDSLKINPAGISDAGSNYHVIITGTCSLNDTSANVSLSVGVPVVINTIPSNQIICVGDSAEFVTGATGTGVTYQWRKGTTLLVNGGNISGANGDSLKINPAGISDAGSNYNVIISGTCSANDTSLNVSLIVGFPLIVHSAPVNQAVCSGGTAVFTTNVSGGGITYQWRKGTVNLINGGNISGANSDSLIINPVNIVDSGFNYHVIIAGACSANDTSANVTLAVTPTPVAIAGSNSPVCNGSSLLLTSQAVSGSTYQWSGPLGFSSSLPNPVIPNVTLSNAGTYILTLSTGGCNSIPASINIIVSNCVADLQVTKTVNILRPLIGHQVVFTIVITNNGPYDATGVVVSDMLQSGYAYVSSISTKGVYLSQTGIWKIDTLQNGASATLQITAIVNATGNYSNTATVSGYQSDLNLTDNISVIETFPTDFFIPEGFSPNGDGINDMYVIRGIESYPGSSISIYNRWGNEVFSQSPYKNNWNGKSSSGLIIGGDELPVGIYYYVLVLDNKSAVIKGTIYLNR